MTCMSDADRQRKRQMKTSKYSGLIIHVQYSFYMCTIFTELIDTTQLYELRDCYIKRYKISRLTFL